MSDTIKDVVTILNKMDSRLDKIEDKFENIESRLDILENPEKYEKPALKDFTNEDLKLGDTTSWLIRMRKFANDAKYGIMENFNFDRVAEVMKFLNWRWFDAKNGVPTVDEIKEEVKSRLDELIETAYNHALDNIDKDDLIYDAGVTPENDAIFDWGVDCGGLHTTIVVFNNSDVRLNVEFIVEGWQESNNADLL